MSVARRASPLSKRTTFVAQEIAWDSNHVYWHAPFSVRFYVRLLFTSNSGGKIGCEILRESTSVDVEQLRGHVRWWQVISVAYRHYHVLFEAFGICSGRHLQMLGLEGLHKEMDLFQKRKCSRQAEGIRKTRPTCCLDVQAL